MRLGDYVIEERQEATFKQYRRFDNSKVLQPLNPKYSDIELSEEQQYVVVGKVVERQKRKRY